MRTPGERETGVGLNVPLEVSGQRRRRVELAQAELEATAALIADQERRVANEVRALYADALAALRELAITEHLNELDTQTAVFVQTRVNGGAGGLRACAFTLRLAWCSKNKCKTTRSAWCPQPVYLS